jgi:hypothetical protein
MTYTCEFKWNVGDHVARAGDRYGRGVVLMAAWDGQCHYLVDFIGSRNFWNESLLIPYEDPFLTRPNSTGEQN